MNQQADETFHLKWDHYGSLHRFALRRSEWQFAKMIEKIRNIHPLFNETLGYIDEDGDCVLFSSNLEMDEMLELSKAKNEKVIRIKTIDNGKEEEEKPKAVPKQEKEVHPNIMCDLCDKFISGIRYKCTVCDDYDLCEDCEKTGIHPEHAMLRLANPRTPKGFEMKRRWMRGGRCGSRHMGGQPRGPITPFVINEAVQNVLQRSATFPQPNAEAPPRSSNPELNKQSEENPNKEAKGAEFLKDVGHMIHQVLSNFGIDVDMSIEHNNKREKISPLVKVPEMTPTALSREAAAPAPFELKTSAELPVPPPRKEDPTQKAAQEVADKTAKEVFEAVSNDVFKKTEELVGYTVNSVNTLVENPQARKELEKFLQNATQASQLVFNQATEMVKQNAENPQFRSIMGNVSQWAEQLAQLYPGINPQESNNDASKKNVQQQMYVDKPTVQNVAASVESEPKNEQADLINLSTSTALEPEVDIPPTINKEMFYKDIKSGDNTSIGTNTEVDKKSAETQYYSDDSDVEIISSSPTATPPPSNVASAQTTNSASPFPPEPVFAEDEGWTLMNDANYEAMCKFYEAKRQSEEAKRKQVEEKIEKRKEQTRLLMEMAALKVQEQAKKAGQPNESPAAYAVYEPTPKAAEAVQNAKKAAQPTAPVYTGNPNGLYPLLQQEEECSAGIPYPTMPSTILPHTKICFFKHPDLAVQNAVDQLESMGYDNCNGWLTRLSEKCKGDISMVLDEAVKDPLHLARLD